jgi:trans-aconitate methyltransferase
MTTAIQTWEHIWEARTLDATEPSELRRLLAADGFEGLGAVDESAWREYVARIGEALGIVPGDSLYDVGCGAGAFLYPWRDAGIRLGGLERSNTLAGFARAALPKACIDVGEAARLDVHEQYDVVVSNGVFLYFPSLDYASAVLARMVKKARRAVAVLDVPDEAHRAETLARRRAMLGPSYDERYRGLDHLYVARDWFADGLRSLGATRIEITDQTLAGYAHASVRYNVVAWFGNS